HALLQALEVEVTLGVAQPLPERAQFIAEVLQVSGRRAVTALVLLAAAAPAGVVAADLLVVALDDLGDDGLVLDEGRRGVDAGPALFRAAHLRGLHRRCLHHPAAPLYR